MHIVDQSATRAALLCLLSSSQDILTPVQVLTSFFCVWDLRLKVKDYTHLQDNQCRYHVKLRGVRATIFTVKSNNCYIFWECVCSLIYPACNAHATYCHVWLVWLKNIFPHLNRGRDSSVDIGTCYGLDGPVVESRWVARYSAPVQTDSEIHPASYTMGTGSLSWE